MHGEWAYFYRLCWIKNYIGWYRMMIQIAVLLYLDSTSVHVDTTVHQSKYQILTHCWLNVGPHVYDAGPTLNHRWFTVLSLVRFFKKHNTLNIYSYLYILRRSGIVLSQPSEAVDPMLIQRWSTVCDVGPALNQHRVKSDVILYDLMDTGWWARSKGRFMCVTRYGIMAPGATINKGSTNL